LAVALFILGIFAFLAVPAIVTSSPQIAHVLGFAQEHAATVVESHPVNGRDHLGFSEGRLERTECAGAAYRVRWSGGSAVVRHCWADVDASAQGDRWLTDPITGDVARSAYDGWLRAGESIKIVEPLRGDPVPLWEISGGAAARDLLRVAVMAGLAIACWAGTMRIAGGHAAWAAGRAAARDDLAAYDIDTGAGAEESQPAPDQAPEVEPVAEPEAETVEQSHEVAAVEAPVAPVPERPTFPEPRVLKPRLWSESKAAAQAPADSPATDAPGPGPKLRAAASERRG
jgi:hypothetical protein